MPVSVVVLEELNAMVKQIVVTVVSRENQITDFKQKRLAALLSIIDQQKLGGCACCLRLMSTYLLEPYYMKLRYKYHKYHKYQEHLWQLVCSDCVSLIPDMRTEKMRLILAGRPELKDGKYYIQDGRVKREVTCTPITWKLPQQAELRAALFREFGLPVLSEEICTYSARR